MKEHIDPVTIQKLDEFNTRRKRLLGLRGICTFLVSSIVLFSILATVDLYVLLPDATRAFLTYAAWIVVATLIWVTSIGKLIRKPNRRELAKYIESQEPSLREDLLSAIELGVERTNPDHDSTVFRQLLQNDVAQRIRSLDIKNTLPIRLISRWIQASAFLLIFLFGLLLIPDFGKNFSTALGRTMFGANLARVSDVSIELISPDPKEIHPEGETIRIKAALKGTKDDIKLVNKVILETTTPDNVYHRTTMEPDNERNFIARLNILSADTKFRIQAGLAQSQWFNLNTASRPKVEHFDITYNPPAYTKLSNIVIKQTTKGDLEGLQGTTVQLHLKTNHPIKEGELRLDLATTPANRTIPLKVSESDPTSLSLAEDSLKLVAQGTYRVHLVSEKTEFDNKYSPKYEIKVNTDQAPSLELINPSRNLLVQADEILAVHAMADDDLPIQKLELHLRTNNGRWVNTILADSEQSQETLQPTNPALTTIQATTKEESPLKKISKNAVTLHHTLDLLSYTLSPGDRVKLKLVAYDLKKQRTETQPIELTILSRSFETSRIETVAAQSRIQQQLSNLLTSLNKVAEDASSHHKLLKTLNSQDPQTNIQWAAFADLTKVVQEDTQHAIEEITKIARTLPKGTAAREAAYTLRTLGRIVHEINTAPPAFIESARESIDKNLSHQYLDDARNRFHEARGRTGSLNAQFQAISAGTLRAILAEDLHNLVKQQYEILPSDQPIQDDLIFWKRLARREKAAVNQSLTIERNIERLGHVVAGRLGTSYIQATHDLKQAREALQTALDQADATQPGPELLAPAKAFKETLVNFLNKAGSNHNSLYSNAVKEHQYLIAQTEDDLHSVYRIIFVGRDLLRNQREEKENRIKGNGKQANINAANARHFQRLLSQATWPGTIGRLKSTAAATETRKDADNQFAKDAGMTALALDNLAQRFGHEYSTQDGDPENVLKDVEKVVVAFRKLEHIHQLVDLYHQVQNIAHTEKWQLRHPSTLVHTPYEWTTATKFMADLGKKMKESQLHPEAVKIISALHLRNESRIFKAEMDLRKNSLNDPAFKPTRNTEELNYILEQIAEALRLVQAEAKEARHLIENHSPTIADLAKQLAEKTKQLKEETEEQAKDAKETQDPETKRADLQQLQDKQEALMAELQDLTNALRQDANTQDVLTDEGRERSRDADDSIAMLQKPANEAEQNLQQANLAQRTEDQVRELNETRDAQDALQKALEKVAEHYENIDNPQVLAETRQELRAAEEELGIAKELEEQYSQVERLAELSQLDPEQLLAALENELENNRLMQSQLSDIAEDTLKETQENLEAAAKEEAEIPKELASSDKDAVQEAKNLAQELKKIGQEARKIAREEVNQANEAARKAQDASASDQLEENRRELDQLGKQAEDAARSNSPSDIAETAKDLIEPLKDIAEELSDAAKDVAELQKTNAQNANQKAQELKKEAENLTAKANDAVQKANELVAAAEAAKQDAIEAQKDLMTANDLALNPDNNSNENSQEPQNSSSSPEKPQTTETSGNPESLASNDPAKSEKPDSTQENASTPSKPALTPDQAEENFDKAVAKAQQAQQAAMKAQQEAAQLRQQANQANREATAAKNLANQFETNAGKAQEALQQSKQAQDKANTASAKTQELAKKAQDIAQQLADALAQISPSENALDQANQQQANINQVAEQAAQDLARAARHEERLGNQDIANELDNLAQNAAQSLEQPVDKASQQLQSLDGDNQLADLAEAAQNIANNEAIEASNAAQKANQEELSQDIGKTAQDLSKAAEQAQIASEQEAPSPSTISEAAKQLAQELKQAAQEFAQQAQNAQQAANELQRPVQEAQENAAKAQQAAQQAQQAAQQASEALQQAQQAQQTAQQAQQASQQAQQQAQDAQQAAQQATQNAAQDPAAAEAAQQAAQQAAQTAQQAQQQAQQAQQAAQQAAQNAQQQAQQAAQQAQQAAQQAQQAEQATPQPAQQIAPKSAKDAQLAAEAAQQAAEAAQQSAAQAAQSASENQGSEVAQQAAQTAQQAATQAQSAAQQAQQAAQQAAEQAESRKTEGQKANNQAAQSAAENAEFSAQTAQQAAQLAAAAAQLAANPEGNPLQTAEKAAQTAQQASQAAQQAAQQATAQANNTQDRSRPETNAAQNAANKAQQAAEQAAQLAQQAGNLAEGLQDAPQPGATPFDQPFAEASQALAQQAQNLDNFFNEGLAQAATPATPSPTAPTPSSPTATPSSPSSLASPSSSSPSAPSSPAASPSTAPFTNPETSQALAQTLDAVDQAVADAQSQAASAEAGAQGQPTGTPAAAGSPLSEAAASQAATSPTPGSPSSPGSPTPGAPSPGAPSPGAPSPGAPTPGAPGTPAPGAPGSPSQSLAQAAQSLAQAAAAQAAAMSQARNASQMPGQNPIGQGLQLDSGAGAAITAGDLPYQKLQDLERKADLEWGKLPKQLAKDLMEGSQEDISGEYRQQVQTYFQAIAELARQNKEN